MHSFHHLCISVAQPLWLLSSAHSCELSFPPFKTQERLNALLGSYTKLSSRNPAWQQIPTCTAVWLGAEQGKGLGQQWCHCPGLASDHGHHAMCIMHSTSDLIQAPYDTCSAAQGHFPVYFFFFLPRQQMQDNEMAVWSSLPGRFVCDSTCTLCAWHRTTYSVCRKTWAGIKYHPVQRKLRKSMLLPPERSSLSCQLCLTCLRGNPALKYRSWRGGKHWRRKSKRARLMAEISMQAHILYASRLGDQNSASEDSLQPRSFYMPGALRLCRQVFCTTGTPGPTAGEQRREQDRRRQTAQLLQAMPE